jgi:tetratricopeptide (TPR) repeat protein
MVACNKQTTPGPPPRYAFLRFENLTGDPDLDWTARAISESLPISLSGALDGPVLQSAALSRSIAALGARPTSAPGISTERPEALAAGASRIVTGYIERPGNGQIRITAVEEDVPTGKTLRTVSASALTPFDAIAHLTRNFSPRAKPPITQKPAALPAYAAGLESRDPTATTYFMQATDADPDFGQAWLALIGTDIVRNDRTSANRDIADARGHKLDSLSRANIDLASARLSNDRPAAIAAMRRLVPLTPGDTYFLRNLANADTTAGDFNTAVRDWQQIAATAPDDVLVWNSLGYARSYAGDYAGALAAFRQYDRLRPKDANPQDSIGDLNYSFRKFKEAAASYLEAYKRQPDFQQAGDLYKAAWAKFEAGDKAGADAVFAQFRAARVKSAGNVTDLIAGDWFFRTGRGREAFSLARKTASETQSAPLRNDLNAQLAIWDLIDNDRPNAARDATAIGTQMTGSAVLIARFASLPSAPAAEWEKRAAGLPPNVAALRNLALGYALLLDGKRAEALPVWQRIVATAGATDFFAGAVLSRLRGQPIPRPLLPDPNIVNQFAGILDKL